MDGWRGEKKEGKGTKGPKLLFSMGGEMNYGGQEDKKGQQIRVTRGVQGLGTLK